MVKGQSEQQMKGRWWSWGSLATGLLLWSVSLPALAETVTPAANSETPPAAVAANTETDYVLGAGDRLRLDIFQVTEYSGEYLVLVDGKVSLPLVGQILVAGLTLEQASQAISEQYAQYLKRPLVTVSLLNPRPLKIAVAGEVSKPGSYEISITETGQFPSVTDLIQLAGGLTPGADLERVEITRTINGQPQLIVVNLSELVKEGELNQDLSLRDGDRLVIPNQETFNPATQQQLATINFGVQTQGSLDITIIGEVARPGSYELAGGAGENQSQSPPRLTEAIAKAGGIKPMADVRRVEVHRFNHSGESQVIAVNLWELLQSGDLSQDLLLQEGDKIIIPTATQLNQDESQSLAAASFSPDNIPVKVVGEVSNPGEVQVPPNTPLNQAILAAGGFNGRSNTTVELIRLNADGTVERREINVNLTQQPSEENNPLLRANDVVVVNTSAFAKTTDVLTILLNPLRIFPIGSWFR